MLPLGEVVLHLIETEDALLESRRELGEQRCGLGVFEELELGDDVVTLFAGADEVDEILQPLPPQAKMIDRLGEHAGEEERVIADVLAHLALAVKRGRLAEYGIGFEQHFADVVQLLPGGVADAPQLIDLGELRQHVGDVLAHLRIAQADALVEMFADQREKELLQWMPFGNQVRTSVLPGFYSGTYRNSRSGASDFRRAASDFRVFAGASGLDERGLAGGWCKWCAEPRPTRSLAANLCRECQPGCRQWMLSGSLAGMGIKWGNTQHKLILMICAICVAAPVVAQKTASDAVMKQVFAVHRFRQTAISPDGQRVAWVETLKAADGSPTANAAIYVAPLSNPGVVKRISADKTGAPHQETEIAWSPDSRSLAFLSDAETAGQPQLWTADVESGATKQLTHLTGFLSDPKWSPDGKTLALLFIENAVRAAGPLVAMEAAVGVIESKIYEQRLVAVSAGGGEAHPISPADMYVYEYDWSPDGKTFAATAAHGSGDDNWWIAQLYTLPAAGGEMKSILKPPLQINMPRWSPDGGSIAYISGLMSDFGAIGGDVYVVPSHGGEARNLTPDRKASASWITWLGSGQILAVEIADGQSAIATVDPASGAAKILWTAAETINAENWSPAASVARDGRTSAVIRSSFEHPYEVWAGPVGAWTQITHANRNLGPMWGQGKSLHWTSDGLGVQGWLLYPRNYDASRKYPLVVAVHGGPAGACQPSWPGYPFTAPLAADGYFVLCPNPRGSFGQGEKFTQGNVKDFGYGDFRDILAGVDEALKQAPVDPQRVGLTGWSYGGYMTMWGVTQTQRFRAAVAAAGLANWLSYYGENDIDQWMIPYFGASVYDDPAVYARSAPITFIKQARTPTLVVVGERDGECPAPQSFEFWHGLKTFGVPTELVVYPAEGHSFNQLDHQRDVVRRMLEWFGKYMPEGK